METFIIWVWLIGTLVLAATFLWAALWAANRFVLRPNRKDVVVALACCLGVLGSILLNPFGNMMIFTRYADARTAELYHEMGGRELIGATVSELEPYDESMRDIQYESGYQLRRYDPNPWFILGWDAIEVRVEDGKVSACWIDG